MRGSVEVRKRGSNIVYHFYFDPLAIDFLVCNRLCKFHWPEFCLYHKFAPGADSHAFCAFHYQLNIGIISARFYKEQLFNILTIRFQFKPDPIVHLSKIHTIKSRDIALPFRPVIAAEITYISYCPAFTFYFRYLAADKGFFESYRLVLAVFRFSHSRSLKLAFCW